MQSLSLLQRDRTRLRQFVPVPTGPQTAEKPNPAPSIVSSEGRQHYLPGALVLSAVLAITFWVHWRGFSGWPGLINNDEGIYMEQAWSVQYQQSLAPYTYMYDHPMFGWITIAAYNWVTSSLTRNPTSVIAGREAMLFIHMVSSLFLYLLARRLSLRPLAAGATVLLFSLSPLGLEYQRMVFLDNVAVMWFIIGMWSLASRWLSLRSASIAGLSLALAVLSKETIAILLPGAALLLWEHRDSRNSRMRSLFHFAIFGSVLLFYPVYATVKNEMLPGPGHVSLWEAIYWQLHGRVGSGSLLDPNSSTFATVSGWLHTDPILIGVATMLVPVAMYIKHLRPVALCLAFQVLWLLKGGYLPYAYATAMFPLAALILAGVGDKLWTVWEARQVQKLANPKRRLQPVAPVTAEMVLVSLLVSVILVTVPNIWGPGLGTAMAARPNVATKEATEYVVSHLPPNAVLVADDDAWTDLKIRGWTAIPTFKLDLDPAIRSKLKNGYHSVNYLLLTTPVSPESLKTEGLTIAATALSHSVPVRSFGGGSLILRRVVP